MTFCTVQTVSEQTITSDVLRTRYCVYSPIGVHVHFQVPLCLALARSTALQCFSWHSFQVPRHSFQLRHVTCFRFRHRSCKTLDCFRDVHTVLRQVRTSHGSAPKRRRLLSFKNWTVLNCVCLDCTQLISLSESSQCCFEKSPNSSSIWRTMSINSLLITLKDLCNHFQFFVQVFCCTYHADPSRVEVSCNSFPKLSIRSSAAAITKSSPWLHRAPKPLLRRCSPDSFCHALLTSCVPYIVLLSLATSPGRCNSEVAPRKHHVHTHSKSVLLTRRKLQAPNFVHGRSTRSVIT